MEDLVVVEVGKTEQRLADVVDHNKIGEGAEGGEQVRDGATYRREVCVRETLVECGSCDVSTWHPLDEHEEVASLLRGAKDANDVRMFESSHHLDLVSHRLAHLPLLLHRVATERDLLDAHERTGSDVPSEITGAEGACADERTSNPVFELDVTFGRVVIKTIVHLNTFYTPTLPYINAVNSS